MLAALAPSASVVDGIGEDPEATCGELNDEKDCNEWSLSLPETEANTPLASV
jgi:hypothetical protein